MTQNLTLEISWAYLPNSKLLIQLPDISPANDIIKLCYNQQDKTSDSDNSKDDQSNDTEQKSIKKRNVSPVLIHDGKILNLSLSLKYQNVKNNDTIIIYEQKEQAIPQIQTFKSSSRFCGHLINNKNSYCEIPNENQNQSLMLEALFHRDKYFQNLEMDKRALFTYHQLLEAQQQTQQNWKQQLQNQLQQHPHQSIQFVFQLGDDSNDLFLDIFGFGFNNNYTYNAWQNKGPRSEQPTKIPTKKKKASVKPLPPLLHSADDFLYDLNQYNEDIFSCGQNQNKGNVVRSIDNNQKYLSEHSCNWKW